MAGGGKGSQQGNNFGGDQVWQRQKLVRGVQQVAEDLQSADVTDNSCAVDHGDLHLCSPGVGKLHIPQCIVNVNIKYSLQQQVQLVNWVRAFGKPNVYAARVVIPSNWNIDLLSQLATSVADREVVQFLTFGWPLNHDGRPTTCTFRNHPSALQFSEHVDRYVEKEMRCGSLLGPFLTLPWEEGVAVSPMSTCPKRGSDRRRIIMDMSWLHDGTSVNDGISKLYYMGQPINLVYLTIDWLCKRAFQLSTLCRGYKRDLN